MTPEEIVGLGIALQNPDSVSLQSPYWEDVQRYKQAETEDREFIEKNVPHLSAMSPDAAFRTVFTFSADGPVRFHHNDSILYFELHDIDFEKIVKGPFCEMRYAALCTDADPLVDPSFAYRVGIVRRDCDDNDAAKLIDHERWHQTLMTRFGWSGSFVLRDILGQYQGKEATPTNVDQLCFGFKEKIKEEMICDFLAGLDQDESWQNLSACLQTYEMYASRGLLEGEIGYLCQQLELMLSDTYRILPVVADYGRELDSAVFAVFVVHTPFDELRTSLPILHSLYKERQGI